MRDASLCAAPTHEEDDGFDELLDVNAVDTIMRAPDGVDGLDFLAQWRLGADSIRMCDNDNVSVSPEFADEGWDQMVDAGWTLGDTAEGDNSLTAMKKSVVNSTRRLGETTRLRKYSWERHEVAAPGKKRMRYRYVNTHDGSIATSLREALRVCRAKESMTAP
tara:strand:- start:2504 stop:2992 length:489 start_codon:yes stop_codon:yes gene_type:complete